MAIRNQSQIWRKKGNDVYRQLQTANFCPFVKKMKLANARQLYSRALLASSTADERASAYKNSGSLSFLRAKFEAKLGQNEEVGIVGKALECCKTEIRQAVHNFMKAKTEGESAAKPGEWMEHLEHQLMEIVDWSVAKDYSSSSDFILLRVVCNAMDEYPPCESSCRAHLRLADVTFKEGILLLGSLESYDGKDYKGCLRCMHECHQPLERAERTSHSSQHSQELLKNIRDMKEQVQLYTRLCESMQAIDSGERMTQQALLDEESLNMDLILFAMDKYQEAALLTREKDTETEAIAMGKIGKIYSDILKIPSKAYKYHFQATKLALSIISPRISRADWYVFSSKKVKEHQAWTVMEEKKGQEAANKVILEKMSGKMRLMKSESKKSAESFLRFLYKEHPHPSPNCKLGPISTQAETKEALRKAILHYHPDTNLKHGQEWVIFCNEAVKLLNGKYEFYK